MLTLTCCQYLYQCGVALAFLHQFIKTLPQEPTICGKEDRKIQIEAVFSVIGSIGTAERCTHETDGTEHIADAAPLPANPAYSCPGQACIGQVHRGS